MFVGLVATSPHDGRPHGPDPFDPSHGKDLGLYGMWLFLVSLAALFAPLLIYCLILRQQSTHWPPPGVPALPVGFWLSTAILVCASVALSRALARVRRGAIAGMRRWVFAALALAVLFVVTQTICWSQYLSVTVSESNWRFSAFLYTFMLVHALHVIGGVAPLVLVLLNSYKGRYSPGHNEGVRHCAMYWHFLDGVWLVMFAAMMTPA